MNVLERISLTARASTVGVSVGVAGLALGLLGASGCSSGAEEVAARTKESKLSAGSSVVHGFAGKCLDVDAGSSDSGAKIQLWTCNGTSAQEWRQANGALVSASGKCLDVQWGNPASGTPVQLWDCNGSDAQRWTFEGDTLVGLGGKCLDVTGGSSEDGTQVQIWDCHGGDWQKWSMDAASGQASGGTTPPAGASPSGGASPSNGGEVWHESFDNGRGMFTNVWGDQVDFSTPGQVTLHRSPSDGDSGMMVQTGGAGSCWGYGVYSFTLSMGPGDAPGPYALLWPATDKWPGPELDMVEVLAGGGAYSTVHWDDDGNNGYAGHGLDGIDVGRVHTYAMRWEAGRLTGYVDGNVMWSTTDHVPADYDHGGENECPGVGMQTWWSVNAQHGDNWITIYDASYSRL